MTEERNALTDLFAACWKDEALKARFMSDPKAVLAEHGVDVPDGMTVKVVENTTNTVNITMPIAPEDATRLTDAELKSAAGGSMAPDCPDGTGDCQFCTNGRMTCGTA